MRGLQQDIFGGKVALAAGPGGDVGRAAEGGIGGMDRRGVAAARFGVETLAHVIAAGFERIDQGDDDDEGRRCRCGGLVEAGMGDGGTVVGVGDDDEAPGFEPEGGRRGPAGFDQLGKLLRAGRLIRNEVSAGEAGLDGGQQHAAS